MSLIRRHHAHLDGRPSFSPGAIVDPAREGTLSIVVPAKDEADNLTTLIAEVVEVFRPMVGASIARHRLDAFEIVVVDDGSTDETPASSRTGRDYPELRPVTLATNVGQSAATAAGFRAARGDWVATLDADLQNDPADLARLWEALPGHRRRARLAEHARGRLVEAGHQPAGRTGSATRCSASRSATRAARSGSSPARWRCGCRCSAAATGSSARCCSARGAGSSRCR